MARSMVDIQSATAET